MSSPEDTSTTGYKVKPQNTPASGGGGASAAAPTPEEQLAQKQKELKDAEAAAAKAKADAERLRLNVQALTAEVKDIADAAKAYETASAGLIKRVLTARDAVDQKLEVAKGGMLGGKLKPADIDLMIKASNDQIDKLVQALSEAQAQDGKDAQAAAQATAVAQQAQATYDSVKNQVTAKLAVIKDVEDLLSQGVRAEAQSNYNALYLYVSLAKTGLAGLQDKLKTPDEYKQDLENALQKVQEEKANAERKAAAASKSTQDVVAAKKALDDAKAAQRANLAGGLG